MIAERFWGVDSSTFTPPRRTLEVSVRRILSARKNDRDYADLQRDERNRNGQQ